MEWRRGVVFVSNRNAYAETLVAGSTGAFSILAIRKYNLHPKWRGSVVLYNVMSNCRPALAVQSLVECAGEGRDGFLRRFGCESHRSDPNRHLDLGRRWSTTVIEGMCPSVNDRPQRHVRSRLDRWRSVACKNQQDDWGADAISGLSGLGSSTDIWGLGFSLDGLRMRRTNLRRRRFLPVERTVQRLWFGSAFRMRHYDMATQPFEVDERHRVPEPTTLDIMALSGWFSCRRQTRRPA